MKRKWVAAALALSVSITALVGTAYAVQYSDEGQISHKEAVDRCSELNIINGYEDGAFHPAQGITRAEFATMMARLLHGGDANAVTEESDAGAFSDISSHWGKQNILYCYHQGIVSGVGGGHFRPDDKITGIQAAKMLLTCLGYDSGREHYTGSYWSANVDIQASSEGLYRKLTGFKPNENLSRDNAAQMIWNALYAKMVQYDGNTLDRGITLLESKYGIKPEKTETQTKGMCGYWTNFIQDVDVCRFYEDGSGEWLDRYDDDHTNFQYTLQGSQLTLHYKNGYQTVLDYITLDELLQTENYDGFTQRIIEELSLPGDFRFYYETNWDYTDPFGNAMFLVPANIIPNKVEESNYWYQSIRMLINTM